MLFFSQQAMFKINIINILTKKLCDSIIYRLFSMKNTINMVEYYKSIKVQLIKDW